MALHSSGDAFGTKGGESTIELAPYRECCILALATQGYDPG